MRFFPTLPLLRRVRHFQLTTKNGPKDYYKGTRSGNTGRHTKHGGFVVDFDKVRTYVVPEGLADFKVRGSPGWKGYPGLMRCSLRHL